MTRRSFAWVSGRYLEVGEDGLATVSGDRVAARVGSEFSDIRDVIQVRLHRGEIVEVLGTKELGGETGSGLLSYNGAIYQVVYVPLVSAGQTISGALRIGFHIDDDFASTLKRLTQTDITFILDNSIVSSSLGSEERAERRS